MKRLSLVISNKSPFSIAASRLVGNVQECLDYIPGTTLRGALANLYLKSHTLNSDFKEIFTDNKVAFCNLYKDGAKPIPLSAYSCKYHGGFLGDKDKHGVVDLLIPLLKSELPEQFKYCQYIEDSKVCNIETKGYRGYYKKNLQDGSFQSVKINKRLVYHTAISHVSETALENTLYSQEVVEKEQVFSGEILVYDDSLLSKVKDLIKGQEVIFLGSDKSSGLGRFEIMSYDKMDNLNKEELKKRVTRFNQKLGLENSKTCFSITFLSDAIVTDRYMRYKSFIEGEDLGIPEAELIHGMVETRIVQGWNVMTALPREDFTAIEKGSVFVFTVQGGINTIIDRLYKLEISGIGKRRSEGFGRLSVCDPFHLQEGSK